MTLSFIGMGFYFYFYFYFCQSRIKSPFVFLHAGPEEPKEPMLILRDLTDVYTPAGAIGSPEDVLRRAKGFYSSLIVSLPF